jgi:glycosyltransferase involved in cell wall biosynthesis
MTTPETICIVPAYNEATVLPQAIPLLMDYFASTYTAGSYLVIIADNGSTDGTDKIARQLVEQYGKALKHELIPEKGRGQALKKIFTKYSDSERYIFIDSDLPCVLSDIGRLLEAIKQGNDLVISRRTGARPIPRRIMTKSLHFINRLVFGINFSDTQCSIKALSPAAAQVLLNDCAQPGWYLDTELVVMASRRGLKVTELPITWIETRFDQRASKVNPLRDIRLGIKAVREIRRNTRSIR